VVALWDFTNVQALAWLSNCSVVVLWDFTNVQALVWPGIACKSHFDDELALLRSVEDQ